MPRWPKREEGMEQPKRARRRKPETAKANLEPPLKELFGKPLKQRGLLSRQADIRRGTDASRIAFLAASRAIKAPLWFPTGKDSVPTDSGHSVRVLLDPAARLEPGARWVNS